ncbi:helix-turn-helix domain-containing protein [Actinoplanes sp. NPDC051851]|uniref:helix-turn-helix domain-containing protein n=1 Tax=Actinoplanes sp. NPDC051851 TaxID=3154753 RepID=UPI003448EAB6
MDGVDTPISGFSTLLRVHRTRSGLTQRQLADFSTISERAIRDLESGRVRHPRRDTVQLIADGLRLGPRARAELHEAAHAGRLGGRLAADLDADPPGPPRAPRPIIARETITATLRAQLTTGTERLVGITGLRGVGKTRLAVEVATRLREERLPVLWHAFPDDVENEYGPPSGPDGLPAVVGAAAGHLYGPAATAADLTADDAADDLVALVADRPALLVVDGAKGPARPGRVAQLLRDCPGLRVLTTSERAPGVPGERVHTLYPLEIPAPGLESDPDRLRQVPSVRVLLAEIDRVRPDYRLTAADSPAVADICRTVDGMPAALRAAAWWLAVYDLATLRRCLSEPGGLLGHLACADDGARVRDGVERRVGALTGDETRILGTLAAGDGDFDLTEAADRTGLTLAHCGRVLRGLLQNGLVCPASVRRPEDNRFRVLNLARAAWSPAC